MTLLVLAPHAKDVVRLREALASVMSPAQIVELTSGESPSSRYRRYLSALHGQARVIIGTRSAAYVPMKDLRQIILVGEAEDNFIDPRSPYVHARTIARIRSEVEGAALLVIGFQRSAEIQQWIEEDWMFPLSPYRDAVREAMPWVRGLNETGSSAERESHSPGARVPGMAFDAIRSAINSGRPVLVQVPRRGYAPNLACASCRTAARCRRCHGPVEETVQKLLSCRWCGHLEGRFRCVQCGGQQVRMTVVGHDRTAEELSLSFPGVPVVTSAGDRVKTSIPAGVRIVVATPGAEPWVEGGALYGAAVILDPWMVLSRADLRAGEVTLRQWAEVTALVEPRHRGGQVIIVADATVAPIQQLSRWDPQFTARQELFSRVEAHFPPHASVAAIDGTAGSIQQLLDVWEQPEGAELLGPVELPAGVRPPAGLEQTRVREARRQESQQQYEHPQE